VPIIICDNCGNKFYKKLSQIKRSLKHYCSLLCQSRARRKGVMVACYLCKKEAYKTRKSLERSKNKIFFCGIGCSNKWHGEEYSRDKHPNWKTGEYSYKLILKRLTTIQKCALCETSNHKILLVHHVDQNRRNNNPSNLSWLCYNCHFLVHHYKKEKERFLKKINADH
jgi:hypothetical protein